MASRRLVDFEGPHGWEFASVTLGRVEPVDVKLAGVTAVRRRVQPVVEFNLPFTVSRSELLDGDRGAEDVDFDDLDRAARQFVEAENAAVFHGSAAAGIDGIVPELPARPDRAAGGGERLPRRRRAGGRSAQAQRHRGRLWPRAGPRGVDAGRRDRRAWRLPPLRPPQEHPRRPDRLDAGARGRGGGRAARRRLRLRLRAGRRPSATRRTTPSRSRCTSRHRSPSGT